MDKFIEDRGYASLCLIQEITYSPLDIGNAQ